MRTAHEKKGYFKHTRSVLEVEGSVGTLKIDPLLRRLGHHKIRDSRVISLVDNMYSSRTLWGD